MSVYSTTAFKYEQHNQEYVSLILPFYVISKISKVLIYGEDKYGYQRKLNERHYKNIKKDIVRDHVILPTSIILSVDKDYIYKFITPQGNTDIVDISFDLDKAEYRIVDGQHRIRGLEEAVKEDKSINEFLLNVIILITEKHRRVVEVEVFRDINSLGKKIKTDLTILAIHNYELLEQKEIEDIGRHIAVKTAHWLNERLDNSVWHKAIQFDIHMENPLGIIGVSAFTNSIYSLAKFFMEDHPYYDMDDREGLVSYTDHTAENLANFIDDAWSEIKKKWSYCFQEKMVRETQDYIKTFYDEGYYLQKTTGTNAVNLILNDCLLRNKGSLSDAIEQFASFIRNSPIKASDWKVGGSFSGLTSDSGFKKAKGLILEGLK